MEFYNLAEYSDEYADKEILDLPNYSESAPSDGR